MPFSESTKERGAGAFDTSDPDNDPCGVSCQVPLR